MKNLNRWIYVIFGVIVMLFSGIGYSWSVMSRSIGASRPDWTATQLSVTFTLMIAFFCISVVLSGLLSKWIPPRFYVLFSGFFFLIGSLIIAQTGSTPALMYLGFGVFCGLGAGLGYNSVMSTITLWFPDRHGLVSGILLMGFGFSSFIAGKVFAAMAPPDGSEAWRSTYRIFGIVILIVMVVCSFFFLRPAEDYDPGTSPARRRAPRQPACEMDTAHMVRRPTFWCCYFWSIFISAAGFALISQASGIATQVGPALAAGTIATVVGLVSIFNGSGRVLFGALFDLAGCRLSMAVNMIVCALATLIMILAVTRGIFPLIVIGFIIGGLGCGGVSPIVAAAMRDFFGSKNYSLNFSLLMTHLLIASLVSTIAGRLFDVTQTYLSALIMMLVLFAGAFAVFWGVRRPTGEE